VFLKLIIFSKFASSVAGICFVDLFLSGVPSNHEHLDIYRVKLIPPLNFLSSLKIVTMDFNTLPGSLHLIEESCVHRPFFNTPRNYINGKEKLICSLE
jgi:hypothetical protein